MRQETNKEIDLLLRRLSRRDGEAVRDAEMNERHLDADELSSYAQNALPASARARYTQHLSECSTCRRLATELSLALGVTTAATPVVAIPASSGLKKFLSSLLSPMVLRYAVPALGVILVMAVGFMVLRQRAPAEEMVAQVDVKSPSLSTPQGYTPGTPAPLADEAGNRQERKPADGVKDDAIQPRESTANKPAESKAPEGTADSIAVASVPAPIPTPSSDTSFTPRTVEALPVQPIVTPKSNITTDGVEAKKEPAKREVKSVAQADSQETKDKAQANESPRDNVPPAGRIASDRANQDKTRADTATVASAGAGERAATRRRAQESRDEESETRSVAGRTFRKERGIWTDTAYDSSIRIVQMARGSEQFRALVADEPAIGTIAERLNGEVIVVWKSRAYRIR